MTPQPAPAPVRRRAPPAIPRFLLQPPPGRPTPVPIAAATTTNTTTVTPQQQPTPIGCTERKGRGHGSVCGKATKLDDGLNVAKCGRHRKCHNTLDRGQPCDNYASADRLLCKRCASNGAEAYHPNAAAAAAVNGLGPGGVGSSSFLSSSRLGRAAERVRRFSEDKTKRLTGRQATGRKPRYYIGSSSSSSSSSSAGDNRNGDRVGSDDGDDATIAGGGGQDDHHDSHHVYDQGAIAGTGKGNGDDNDDDNDDDNHGDESRSAITRPLSGREPLATRRHELETAVTASPSRLTHANTSTTTRIRVPPPPPGPTPPPAPTPPRAKRGKQGSGQGLATDEVANAMQGLSSRMAALAVTVENLTVALWASQLQQTPPPTVTAGPSSMAGRGGEGEERDGADLMGVRDV